MHAGSEYPPHHPHVAETNISRIITGGLYVKAPWQCPEYLPRIVRVRTMFFMIFSQTMLHVLSGASILASRWLSSILTSTCFICCILLALELLKRKGLILIIHHHSLSTTSFWIEIITSVIQLGSFHWLSGKFILGLFFWYLRSCGRFLNLTNSSPKSI